MEIFFLVFFLMALLIIAMSVGVLFGKKPISGSCGGMSALGMEVACDICGGDKTRCEKENQEGGEGLANDLGYDASKKS